MASSALDEMFEEIEGLLEVQHALSARWYARHSGMPVDEARATLEAYLKKRGKGKASATFLLGGTPASGGGQMFKLASAASLDELKAGFSTITTKQLYSLHAPAMPGGDELPLAAIATAQDKSLYEQVGATASHAAGAMLLTPLLHTGHRHIPPIRASNPFCTAQRRGTAHCAQSSPRPMPPPPPLPPPLSFSPLPPSLPSC
jgi:hypothetical protein